MSRQYFDGVRIQDRRCRLQNDTNSGLRQELLELYQIEMDRGFYGAWTYLEQTFSFTSLEFVSLSLIASYYS